MYMKSTKKQAPG